MLSSGWITCIPVSSFLSSRRKELPGKIVIWNRLALAISRLVLKYRPKAVDAPDTLYVEGDLRKML